MQEIEIIGHTAAYATPDGAGPFPGVVVLHEVFGLNRDIRRIVLRLAALGYAAAAPDLYSQGPRALGVAQTLRDTFAGGGETVERVGAIRGWLARQGEVDDDRLAIMGFGGLGGGVAVVAAARFSFQAAAINYGGVPDDDAALEGICPVVGSYGAKDRATRAAVRRLRAALERREIPHDIKVYPEAGHGFMNQSLPAVVRRLGIGYQPEPAEDSWKRIDDFFAEHLPG